MVKTTYVKSRKVYKLTFTLPKTHLPDEAVESLTLVGSFNDWHETSHPLKSNKKGEFSNTVEVDRPGAYEYRYLLNGETWLNDWHATGYIPNSHGSDNCVVIVPEPND